METILGVIWLKSISGAGRNGKRWFSETKPGLIDAQSMITLMSNARGLPMSSITVRNLDPGLKDRLRIRAAQHGHSMEAEARSILRQALSRSGEAPRSNLYERIRARFAEFGGVDLEIPSREPGREPPRFD